MINEILEILKNIGYFTVVNTYNLLSNVKYKLQKNKNITYKIIEAPKFNKIPNQKIIHTSKQPYEETIENFVSTMAEKLPKESLSAMYHNLKTLKIKDSKNTIFSFPFSGMYNTIINRIKLYTRKKDSTITHELLHMSSSIIGKNNMACGFAHSFVGKNLNEGYTEILNNRLFEYPIIENSFYGTYAKFASAIEDIIGKDNMTILYFNADLKGLFEKLSRYISKEKTSIFLKDLDSLFQFNGIGYNLSLKRLDRMINYLTDVSINYVNESVKCGTLSFDEAKLFLYEYKNKIIYINTHINQLVTDMKVSIKIRLNVANDKQSDMSKNNKVKKKVRREFVFKYKLINKY